MSSAVRAYLENDHREIDALLDAAVAGDAIDLAAFQRFRARLLRHIALEEKIVFVRARQRGTISPELARRLRVEHGAIAALLVPTPDLALVAELRALLAPHDRLEEDAGGVYERCDDAIGGDADAAALVEQMRAVREPPVARHFDGQGTVRTAAEALAAAARMRPPRAV
jgi:hypothetical protein